MATRPPRDCTVVQTRWTGISGEFGPALIWRGARGALIVASHSGGYCRPSPNGCRSSLQTRVSPAGL